MKESQFLSVGHSVTRNMGSTVARIDQRTRLIEQRLSGILLHISSLPGRFGIGDLGSSAYEFVDFLSASGQSLWSILPLNAVLEQPEFCPYSPISAFATNYLLISPEKLLERGFLEPDDLKQYPSLPHEMVDFPGVVIAKAKLLRQAFERFRMKADEAEKEAFQRFCDSKAWLPGFATYVTGDALNGKLYLGEWKRGKDVTRSELSNELDKQVVSFGQFIFFEQWNCLKNYANNKGIYIAGDIPYSVARESYDLWESPELFEVDPITGQMQFEAGAPPDEFAPNGQAWGIPTYAWLAHKQDGFKWWRKRVAEIGALHDAVRLDHFRGFEAIWAIPAGSKGPADGYYVKGPGKAFFEAIRESSSAEIFVEDLGFITDEVHALRESMGLPGMSVLQFAFSGQKDHPYLPYKCLPTSVIYTETHDLKPMVGWFRDLSPTLRKEVEKYLGVPVTERNVHWEFIRLALSSVARWALIPVQDLLGLGNEARMNITGQLSPHNWRWRLASIKSLDSVSEDLFNLTQVYGRLPVWR
jgi:4-alpha-glucanotransferase